MDMNRLARASGLDLAGHNYISMNNLLPAMGACALNRFNQKTTERRSQQKCPGSAPAAIGAGRIDRISSSH